MGRRRSKPKRGGGDYYFDEAAAGRACDFFPEFLRHIKGPKAGEPFELDEWQAEEIIRPLFGWKRADGTRRYRTGLFAIPRKNGKSTLGAGIGDFMLFGDGEPGAEVYTCAADRDQASIIYDLSLQMASGDEDLRALFKANRNSRTMYVDETASVMKALSADAFTKHGLNPHLVLFDELHAQRDRELWDVMETALGAREQPLMLAITTAGYDRHSICYEVWDYARKVRDGVIRDESFLPVIFEAGEDDDWTDPKTWAKANPGIGSSVRLDYLEERCERAQNSPAAENAFRQLHLNQWTEQAVRWLQMAKWDACAGDVNPADLDGLECFGGLDLASTTDTSSFVLYFPEPKAVLPFFWIPEERAREKEKTDRVPYRQWADDGLVRTTPGNVTDYDFIRRDINALGKRYNVREIAVDRWNAAQITTQLGGDGFTMVPFGQGYASMSAPSKHLEALVLAGELAHFANPVLRWMASNVAVQMDAAENLKPDKAKSTQRIDGIVGLVMAIGRAIATEPAKASVYESRGILIL